MGYYIETGELLNKARDIIAKYHAERIPEPTPDDWSTYKQLGQAIICVVNNGQFDAAAFAFERAEIVEFTQITDSRPKTWLIMPWDEAKKASGFKD